MKIKTTIILECSQWRCHETEETEAIVELTEVITIDSVPHYGINISEAEFGYPDGWTENSYRSGHLCPDHEGR